ncbi:hypothetical protein F4823DRAFT_311418 [Ustulina deusta]|nr:hypothetical protein F4823DRAFT_311418 [Ustulina deusta]
MVSHLCLERTLSAKRPARTWVQQSALHLVLSFNELSPSTSGSRWLPPQSLAVVLPSNQSLSWVAPRPGGKPHVEHRDTVELLCAFRDGIKAHKSLYQQGRILHRDASLKNILITEPEEDRDPRGILIDLDVAIDLHKGPRHASDIFGTKLFIGIGNVLGEVHKYRHDL